MKNSWTDTNIKDLSEATVKVCFARLQKNVFSSVFSRTKFLLVDQLSAVERNGIWNVVDLLVQRSPETRLKWVLCKEKQFVIFADTFLLAISSGGKSTFLDFERDVLIRVYRTETGIVGQIDEVTFAYQDNGKITEFKIELPGRSAAEIVPAMIRNSQPSQRKVVLVYGNTGAGKSTLIKSLGCVPTPEIGKGKAVPHKVQWHYSRLHDIAIIDMPGWELGQGDATYDLVKGTLKRHRGHGPGSEVDAIWFCVKYTAGKIQQAELDFVQLIASESHVPVVIVVTQSPQDVSDSDELIRELIKSKLQAKYRKLVTINAEEERMGNLHTRQHGLERLLEVTRGV